MVHDIEGYATNLKYIILKVLMQHKLMPWSMKLTAMLQSVKILYSRLPLQQELMPWSMLLKDTLQSLRRMFSLMFWPGKL